MKPIRSSLLFICIVFYSGAESQTTETKKYANAIKESHRIIDSLQRAGKIPGIDVAVSIDGKIVWSEAFGFADLEQNVPVKAGQTRFRIGSVSKSLTAAALGRLMDMNKIDITQPIQKYVPYFPEKKFPLTVKQVGGHIGGIRHYRNNEFLINTHYASVKESLTIFSNDSLLSKPGTRFSYSSYGFNLLSAAIEGASGEEFLPFIQREVFSKLGMNSTCADENSAIIQNRTSFYQLENGKVINAPYVDNSYKWAGGGFISTTTDLIKFGEAHIKPGFLTEKTLNELLTSQELANGNKTGYGVGWFIFENAQPKGFGHGGGSVGGITSFQVYPKEKLIIVLLSNSSDTNYGNVTERIINLFIKDSTK